MGLSSVYKIAAKLNLTDKVYGELYKLFTVDELYRTAVEVIAGNSLFHVVVDSDDTVSKILNVMNKEKSGRVTFMPINRIHANPITVRMENVRNTIEMLKYDVRFDGPIKQVFGKSVVCKDLDTCDSAARKHNVTAVTFGGDRVGRKGDISGGYHDKRKSRLDAVCNLILATNQLEEETKRLAETQKLLQDCDAKILGVRDNISHLERKRRDVLNERDPLTLARSSLIRKKDLMTDIMSQKITSRAAIDGVYKAFSIQIDAYVAEMETNLVSKLDRAESERLSELSKLITSTTNDLRNIADERVEIEGKKSIGFVELNSNLIRRRDDLEKKLENIGQGGVISKLELASKTKELANLKVRVVEIAERITGLFN